MGKRIALIVETIENKLPPTHMDQLNAGNRLSADSESPVTMLITGEHLSEQHLTPILSQGVDITLVEHPSFRYPNPHLTAAAASQWMGSQPPDIILLPHTTRAAAVAAALAHGMSAACITGVERIYHENGLWHFQKSVFNGNLVLQTVSNSRRAVATLLTGAFSQAEKPPSRKPDGKISRFAIPDPTAAFSPVDLIAADTTDNAVEDADVIVAAGRGIGEAARLELVHRTAALFKNGTVGGSRTVCDLGWLPYSRQIGETGRQVAPKLYIACGISGARQHTVGMQNAQTVIAVNLDSHAAIFNVADYGIVEDLNTFLPLLLELAEGIENKS